MGAIQNKLEGPVSDELTLVRAAKQGDDSAFEELVRRYDRNVFRIAQHITQNREDAEDVVQEAFLKAYGNLAKFQEQSKFYTWLVRIAVNEALMKLRRRKPGGRPWIVLLKISRNSAWLYCCSGFGLQSAISRGSESSSVFISSSSETVRSGFRRRNFINASLTAMRTSQV